MCQRLDYYYVADVVVVVVIVKIACCRTLYKMYKLHRRLYGLQVLMRWINAQYLRKFKTKHIHTLIWALQSVVFRCCYCWLTKLFGVHINAAKVLLWWFVCMCVCICSSSYCILLDGKGHFFVCLLSFNVRSPSHLHYSFHQLRASYCCTWICWLVKRSVASLSAIFNGIDLYPCVIVMRCYLM